MSTNLLNFNKPCSACRRRKVRCDKESPCNNCVRHGSVCVYDDQRESAAVTPESQQMLQDRIERLEKMIEDMASLSVQPAEPNWFRNNSISAESPASQARRESPPPTEEQGFALYEQNLSYYVGPSYWMNLHDFSYEPRFLLRIDDVGETEVPPSPSWPISRMPTFDSMAQLHLSTETEDLLIELLFKHVEPFIRLVHEAHFRREVRDFRTGLSKIPREVEAVMFATQALTVAALPSSAVRELLGEYRRDLLARLLQAVEISLDRASVMRSRKPITFVAFLYYTV
jgi:hypothetical protein